MPFREPIRLVTAPRATTVWAVLALVAAALRSRALAWCAVLCAASATSRRASDTLGERWEAAGAPLAGPVPWFASPEERAQLAVAWAVTLITLLMTYSLPAASSNTSSSGFEE